MVAGVQRDDEVIVPALTFVATANTCYQGAVPLFADCEQRTAWHRCGEVETPSWRIMRSLRVTAAGTGIRDAQFGL